MNVMRPKPTPATAQFIDIVRERRRADSYRVGLIVNIEQPDQLGKVGSKVLCRLLRDHGQPPVEEREDSMRETGKRRIPAAAADHSRLGLVSDIEDYHTTVDIAQVGPVRSLRHDQCIMETKGVHHRTGHPLKFLRLIGSLARTPPASHFAWAARIPYIDNHVELIVYRIRRSEISCPSRKMSKLPIDTPNKVHPRRGRTAGVKKGEQPRGFRLCDVVNGQTSRHPPLCHAGTPQRILDGNEKEVSYQG